MVADFVAGIAAEYAAGLKCITMLHERLLELLQKWVAHFAARFAAGFAAGFALLTSHVGRDHTIVLLQKE